MDETGSLSPCRKKAHTGCSVTLPAYFCSVKLPATAVVSLLCREALRVLLLLLLLDPDGSNCSLYGSLGLFDASAHALQLLLNALPAVKAVTATSSTTPRSSAHAAPADRWWTGCLLAIHSFAL